MYTALQAGGLPDIKTQHLTSSLRNRTMHKCDLTNACSALDINIELTSLKDAGVTSRTEHHPAGMEF